MKDNLELDPRILEKNLEISKLTQQVDSLRSTLIDLREQHENFVTELQKHVQTLTDNLQDLKMDVCRNELDKRLWE